MSTRSSGNTPQNERPNIVRSGIISAVALSSLLLILGTGCKGKGKNRLQRLTTMAEPPVPPQPIRPGGQDIVTVSRSQTFDGATPEFLSMTLLPGRGMNILQIKAFLPGKGEISLLEGLKMDEAIHAMTGTGPDAHGEVNLQGGATFALPYTNPLSGTPTPDGKKVVVNLHGRNLTLPVRANFETEVPDKMTRYGLLQTVASTSLQKNSMPDGEEIRAVYDVGNFQGKWPGGKLQATISTILSGRAVDLTITVRNDGAEPTPLSIAWYPRFIIPSGNRSQVTLRLPVSSQIEQDHAAHVATGRVQGRIVAEQGYNARAGQALGSDEVDSTFVHMKPALFDSGPTVELQDRAADFGLRVATLASSINGVRISAPAGKNYIGIYPQANPYSPSGKLLDTESDTDGMLYPGKTMQWRVRLELFSPSVRSKPSSY